MSEVKVEKQDPITLVEDAWERSEKVQSPRNDIYLRLWHRYKAFNDDIQDKYRSNVSIPKTYSVIETITPRLAKAIYDKRPYIPIRVDQDEFEDAASRVETVLDTYLHKDNFKIKGVRGIKMIGAFGTAFYEPYPDSEIVTEKRRERSSIYPFSEGIEEEKVRRFRLKTRLWTPWQAYFEPNMRPDMKYGYVILIDEVSRTEIEEHYKVDIRAKVKEAVDTSSAGGERQKNFSETLLTSLGIARPDDDDSHGILMRYLSKDRHITTWNGIVVLEDKSKKDNRIKLSRVVYNEDPMMQNGFWGQGEAKIIENLCDKLEENLDQTFDNHNLLNQGVFQFDPEVVDPYDVVMVPGVRIPIDTSGTNSVFGDALEKIDTQGLPADHYKIPALLERFIDLTTGSFDISRGEPTQAGRGQKSATEAGLLFQHGDLRSELKVMIIEMLGLADFADLCTEIIDEYATPDDLYEILGEDMADVITMNPYNLPGSFNYQFKGSASINDDFRKRENFNNIMATFKDHPAWRPGADLRQSLSLNGQSEKEIDKLVFTEEQMMQMAKEQAEAEEEQQSEEFDREMVKQTMSQAGASAQSQ